MDRMARCLAFSSNASYQQVDSFLAIVQTDTTYLASSMSRASLPKLVPLWPGQPWASILLTLEEVPRNGAASQRSAFVPWAVSTFLLAASVSVAPLTNTRLYQICLILADFRSEHSFLHVVLALISGRTSCQRCLATVLCVFLLIVAIHRSLRYEGLGYDNARTPSWLRLYWRWGWNRGPCFASHLQP